MKSIKVFICLFPVLFCNLLVAQTWHSLNFSSGPTGGVYCLKTINNELYVGGGYLKTQGAPGDGIAKFDGQYWDSIDCGTGGGVFSIEKYNDGKIYVGGPFVSFCNDPLIDYIVRWNVTNWEKFSIDAPNGEIYSLQYFQNDLYLGGGFGQIGSLSAYNIAKWNGINYSPVGGGVTGMLPTEVFALAVYDGKLIVGGGFDWAGGYTVNNIAAWDGTTWTALGGGLNDAVFALYTDTINNLLYAGGNFTMADTVPAFTIACWDGTKWKSLLDSTTSKTCIIKNGVRAISTFNNKLYVAGLGIGNSTDTIMACWDGAHWTEVPGPKGGILALNVYKGNLYVGGGMGFDSDSTMNYLACYGDSCPQNVGIKERLKDNIEYLGSNIPNPFKNTTTIPYYVPINNNGVLKITDIKGMVVKEFTLQYGKNNLEISMLNFKSGIYLYSIIIDGVVKDTKKMVVQ